MKRQRDQQPGQSGSFQEAIATAASKLHVESPIFSEQTANQNTNIALQCCNVARKRTSGLTVKHKESRSELAVNNLYRIRELNI